MSREKSVYRKDFLKFKLYGLVKKKAIRFQTGMDQIMLQLELRDSLPNNATAIEMFGMHGLWHTMDYINKVKQCIV